MLRKFDQIPPLKFKFAIHVTIAKSCHFFYYQNIISTLSLLSASLCEKKKETI